jgi:hypothetical protein
LVYKIKIKGKISKTIDGELIKAKYIVKKICVFMFLKNSNSAKKLIIKTKLIIINII